MNYCVYKYVVDDEIVYIGKTNNIDVRNNCHFRPYDNIKDKELIKQSVLYYANLPNKKLADETEVQLIKKYKPKLNIRQYRTNKESKIPDLQWKRFYPFRHRASYFDCVYRDYNLGWGIDKMTAINLVWNSLSEEEKLESFNIIWKSLRKYTRELYEKR